MIENGRGRGRNGKEGEEGRRDAEAPQGDKRG